MAGKYAVQVGENIVYDNLNNFPHLIYEYSALLFDYPYFVTTKVYCTLSGGYSVNFYINKPGNYVVFSSNSSEESGNHFFLSSVLFDGGSFLRKEVVENGSLSYFSVTESDLLSGPIRVNMGIRWAGNSISVPIGSSFPISLSGCYMAYADVVPESLSINRKKERPVYFPEGLGAGLGIAIDTGAATTMDLDQVLQGVLDGVLEGTLTSTMAIAEEAVVDPPAEELPDVDNLGLPALGQALTSRFPFSIPWDFFRAVQLLAAPAKAPYFEVDFMEPLADEVGGWQGSTTVVLDFSEYAIIGQISRWTSTIGFCLMLAGATKRLIWTV